MKVKLCIRPDCRNPRIYGRFVCVAHDWLGGEVGRRAMKSGRNHPYQLPSGHWQIRWMHGHERRSETWPTLEAARVALAVRQRGDQWCTETELSTIIGISRSALGRMRRAGGGPPHRTMAGDRRGWSRVLYRLDEAMQWLVHFKKSTAPVDGNRRNWRHWWNAPGAVIDLTDPSDAEVRSAAGTVDKIAFEPYLIRHLARMRAANPGRRLNRTHALRSLLMMGALAAEGESK